MSGDYFHHPFRFPKNAEGPFYTTGYQCRKDDSSGSPMIWCGDCLACEAPEHEAPDLLAPLRDENYDTYFLKQPSNKDEIERACNALQVCCVEALRYGGKDLTIINRLNNDPRLCDYTVDGSGNLVLTADAETIIRNDARNAKLAAKLQRRWWQFWKWF